MSRTLMMKCSSSRWTVFFALAFALVGAWPAQGRPVVPGEFPLREAPTKADWQSFMRASDQDREKLWLYQTHRGRHLADWAWGWRLGWVRVCRGEQVAAYCDSVLQEALLDKAMVVRAEAVTVLGDIYDGKANAAVVRLLQTAYGNPRNQRHGKPLMVQKRILFALHRIGGEAALKTGAALAATNPGTASYWQQLAGPSAW